MNHTDTEKYKTHSCFALCPVRLHTGVCSGVKGIVFFLKSVRALLTSVLWKMEQNQTEAGPHPLPHLKTMHLLPIMGTKSSLRIFYLFFPKVWSIVYFKSNRVSFNKILQSFPSFFFFPRWNCNHRQSRQNRILLLSSCSWSFNSSASR